MKGLERLNRKALTIDQGAIRIMFDKAAKMKDVISLGIGEPDMDTNKEICSACANALFQGKTHYAPNAGIEELRIAISKHGLIATDTYDPYTEIIVTNGGMGAYALLMQVILEVGDEVLIQDPQYLNFEKTINYVGGVAVPVPTDFEGGFCMRAEDVRRLYKKNKTKALVINSPNNPTGEVIPMERLVELANVAKELDLLVISDEVYGRLLYDGAEPYSIANLPDMKERTVVLGSFSKEYAMTGWRLGYAAGPRGIIDRMTKVQEYFNSCINTPAQMGAIYALNNKHLVNEIKQSFTERREIALKVMDKINGLKTNRPKGAFYLFPNVSAFGMTSMEFCDKLLEEAGVVCIPGSAFGGCGEGHIRISYSTQKHQLIRALERFEDFCSKLK